MKTILHVDMDAFFASVEVVCNPKLKGKPVVVCGDTESRSVVASASYEARRYGVKAGMPVAIARFQCPHGIFIAGDPEKYVYIHIRLNSICREFSPIVEPYSIDESFLDITEVKERFGGAVELARSLKARIRQELNLSCSVGIAPNKLLAKTASDLQKPDGLTVLDLEDLPTRFHPLPVEKLFGVGEKTAERLRSLGVVTIGDLARLPVWTLRQVFGVVGEWLHSAACGEDASPVIAEGNEPPAKSVGNNYTLHTDSSDPEVLETVLLALCSKVGRRLRKAATAGRTVTLVIRFSDFSLVSRSRTLDQYINHDGEIFEVARSILLQTKWKSAIRLLGVSVSNLTSVSIPFQPPLFDRGRWFKYRRLTETADRLRDRYGERVVVWARMSSTHPV